MTDPIEAEYTERAEDAPSGPPASTRDVTSLAVRNDGALQLADPADMKRALDAFDARRATFREWLFSHFVRGVHYGFPPGCQPDSNVPPEQWVAKPSLYKAGAEMVVDLMQLNVKFEADQEMWAQFGKKAGTICVRCRLFNSAGVELGMGSGLFKELEKKKMQGNAALKMAQKRAMVDAVIYTYRLSDLFTQDTEDLQAKAREKAKRDAAAPEVKPRAERKDVNPVEAKVTALYKRWMGKLNDGAQDFDAFEAWSAKELECPMDLHNLENWSEGYVAQLEAKL